MKKPYSLIIITAVLAFALCGCTTASEPLSALLPVGYAYEELVTTGDPTEFENQEADAETTKFPSFLAPVDQAKDKKLFYSENYTLIAYRYDDMVVLVGAEASQTYFEIYDFSGARANMKYCYVLTDAETAAMAEAQLAASGVKVTRNANVVVCDFDDATVEQFSEYFRQSGIKTAKAFYNSL